MSRVAYVNGQYVPHGQATVHVEDRGFQFAAGVYEVWSVFDGRMADFDGHMTRLRRSLNELRIPIPMTGEALKQVLKETVRRNRVREGLVYIQVTRGTARRDHPFPPEGTPPSVIVTARSLPLREAREVFEREYLAAQIMRFGGNISRTAAFIGMERSALHRKLKSLGVSPARGGEEDLEEPVEA